MRETMSRATRGRTAAATALALVTAIAAIGAAGGCGTSDSSSSAQPSPNPSVTVAASSPFTVKDPWVKAADSGMTGAFGTLVNDGDTDLTIVSATSSVSPVGLHEMAMKDGKMVMQPKVGGFTIKAKSSRVLEPGGDHLMLMNLGKPVKAGDEVTITVTFADGKTAQFTAIAKPFTGARESYGPDMHMSPAA